VIDVYQMQEAMAEAEMRGVAVTAFVMSEADGERLTVEYTTREINEPLVETIWDVPVIYDNRVVEGIWLMVMHC